MGGVLQVRTGCCKCGWGSYKYGWGLQVWVGYIVGVGMVLCVVLITWSIWCPQAVYAMTVQPC